MATALQSQTDKRPGAQSQKHGHQQQQQQQQQQQLRKRKWEEDDAGVPVEVSTPEKIIVHEIRTFFTNQGREHKPWRTSLLNRARTAAQDQGLRLKRATVWTTDWMLQGGTWQTFFSAAVGTILFLALAAIAAIAVFVLTSATNAAITSLLMSVSIVGLFLAFFFSAVSLVYFGVVGFGGLAISSVALLSVCVVLFFSGLVAITSVIWQALKKCAAFARGVVTMVGATLLSFSGSERIQIVTSN